MGKKTGYKAGQEGQSKRGFSIDYRSGQSFSGGGIGSGLLSPSIQRCSLVCVFHVGNSREPFSVVDEIRA